MDKVQAPVLIFHGSADRNVPPAQSWSFFRALEYYGKTVKFVVFPGEPHGPQKLTHQVRKVADLQGMSGTKVRTKDGGQALVPELIKRGDLEVGRFEVTAAQYMGFIRASGEQKAEGHR